MNNLFFFFLNKTHQLFSVFSIKKRVSLSLRKVQRDAINWPATLCVCREGEKNRIKSNKIIDTVSHCLQTRRQTNDTDNNGLLEIGKLYWFRPMCVFCATIKQWPR